MTPLVLALLAAAPTPPSAALTALERAHTALETGDAARASTLAMQAIRKSGKDASRAVAVHRGAQDLLLSLGKRGELIRYYDRFLRTDVRDAFRRYLRARVEEDVSKRRRDLESVLLSSPDMFWAAYDLAEAYALEGNWRRAVEYAERAVKIAPNEKAAWNVLGHLRLEQARMRASPDERKRLAEAAREALERAVALDGRFLDALYNLGLVNYLLGERERAKQDWRRALSASPGYAPALNSLGHLAAREGKLDDAIGLYLEAIESDATYGTAHNNLAVAYYRKREYRRAQKHLALAEANQYDPSPSFARALMRAVESQSFAAFKTQMARARKRTISVTKAGEPGPLGLSQSQREGLISAVLKARFRDSHGGVAFADAGSLRGGEKRVGDTVVARYVVAATIALTLDGESRTLVAIAREAPATRKRALATWFADEGGRFSARSAELARALAARLDLPVYGAE